MLELKKPGIYLGFFDVITLGKNWGNIKF